MGKEKGSLDRGHRQQPITSPACPPKHAPPRGGGEKKKREVFGKELDQPPHRKAPLPDLGHDPTHPNRIPRKEKQNQAGAGSFKLGGPAPRPALPQMESKGTNQSMYDGKIGKNPAGNADGGV